MLCSRRVFCRLTSGCGVWRSESASWPGARYVQNNNTHTTCYLVFVQLTSFYGLQLSVVTFRDFRLHFDAVERRDVEP